MIETTDIGLASYLQIKGFQCIIDNKSNGTKCVFTFQEASPELLQGYSQNEGQFLSFATVMRNLKSQVSLLQKKDTFNATR